MAWKKMRMNKIGIIFLVFVFAASFAVTATTTPVSAANSCTAQLSSPTATYFAYNSNIGLTVPVSATCSFSGGQLYAVGYAYDTSTNTAQSSANTMLTWTSSTYSGQLGFKLSPTLLGHNLQIAVSVYGPNSFSPSANYSPGNFPGCDTASMACNYGQPYQSYWYASVQYGQLLTSTSETVQISPINYQTNYPTQYQSCSYYQTCNSPYSYPQSCGYYQGCSYQGAYCSSHNPYCYYNGNPAAEYCSSISAYCDFTYNVCQSPTSLSNQAQCSGYLYQPLNGCVELEVPVNSPYAAQVYQYYTLNNLPSSHPPLGSWVTVIGTISQGYSGASSYSATCPGNYINVSSIS